MSIKKHNQITNYNQAILLTNRIYNGIHYEIHNDIQERYSPYEGYYICSSISTPFFQVSGKFFEFRPIYFSKNGENVAFWPYILTKMRKMS